MANSLLVQIQNLTADMVPLNNENPNGASPAIVGAFSVIGLEAGDAIFSANIIPMTQNVDSYLFELAFYPDLKSGLAGSQNMWYWSAPDRERVILPIPTASDPTPPPPSNPQEAQRLGGKWFQIDRPAGANWAYVRISDITGTGNPAVSLMVWRDVGR